MVVKHKWDFRQLCLLQAMLDLFWVLLFLPVSSKHFMVLDRIFFLKYVVFCHLTSTCVLFVWNSPWFSTHWLINCRVFSISLEWFLDLVRGWRDLKLCLGVAYNLLRLCEEGIHLLLPEALQQPENNLSIL